MVLSSCSKDRDINPQTILPETKGKELFGGEVAMQNFDLVDSKLQEDDKLRAYIQSKGYTVPELDVSNDEFQKKSSSVYWGVMGAGKYDEGSIEAGKSQTGFFKVKEETGKNKIKFACFVDDGMAPYSEKFAYFALGGKRDGRYLEFSSNKGTSPNAKIQGLVTGEKQIKRQIPLITEVLPFDKVLSKTEVKPKVLFNPQGCLLGFCFINRFKTPITLTKIELLEDNPVFFEGKFDMRRGESNTDFVAEKSTGATGESVPFEGITQKFIYPIYQDETTQGYALNAFAGNLESAKAQLPLFHLWAMPRGINRGFIRFRVHFKKGDFDHRSRIFEIDQPMGGFEKGKAYRLPIQLDHRCVENPLMYVSKYALNKGAGYLGGVGTVMVDGKAYPLSQFQPHPLGFVSDYSLLTNSPQGTGFMHQVDTDEMKSYLDAQATTSVGYFNGNEAIALFSEGRKPDWLTNYELPTSEQWDAIVPYTGNVHFNKSFSKSDRDWTRLRDEGILQTVFDEADFASMLEDGHYVTYAHRFKNTKWESAWRYALTYTDGKIVDMTIMCVGALGGSELDIDDIKNGGKDFFTSRKATKRIFPAYGRFAKYDTGISNQIVGSYNNFGGYHSSTIDDGTNMLMSYFFKGASSNTGFDNLHNSWLPIIPFLIKLY